MSAPRVESELHPEHADPAGRLAVTIVTPTGAVLSRQVEEVTAPGVLGEFGVLPGHVPFLSALKAGVLGVRDGGQKKLIAVGPGFFQVGAEDQVRVLVEMAAAPADIDVAAARAEEAQIVEEMKQGAAGGELEALQARLDWARARIAVAASARAAS